MDVVAIFYFYLYDKYIHIHIILVDLRPCTLSWFLIYIMLFIWPPITLVLVHYISVPDFQRPWSMTKSWYLKKAPCTVPCKSSRPLNKNLPWNC